MAERKPVVSKGLIHQADANRALARFNVNEIVRSGNSPLDVMMRNMLFWAEQTERYKNQLEDLISSMTGDENEGEERKRAIRLFDAFMDARGKSQECAVNAAPYVHPRLQSVAVKTEKTEKITVKMVLPKSEEAERAYRTNGKDAGAGDDSAARERAKRNLN